MDISTRRCKSIIADVDQAVARWPQIASEIGIKEKTTEMIRSKLFETKPV